MTKKKSTDCKHNWCFVEVDVRINANGSYVRFIIFACPDCEVVKKINYFY